MRPKGLLGLAAVAILFAGCGGDDESDLTEREEEAREAVIGLIGAYQDGDYQAVCDLQDELVNETIPKVTKTDSCPEGYEELFRRQRPFAGGDESSPFDDFVDSLADYEVGKATLTETDGTLSGQVLLEGPEEAASLVVEEDGEMKVSELFVTPDANTPGGPSGAGLSQ